MDKKVPFRDQALEELARIKATLIFFETGPRIKACLQDIKTVLGDRDIVLTRELTKRYEEARHGDAQTLIESVEKIPPKGELVLLVGPPQDGGLWTEAEVLAALVKLMPEAGMKRASGDIATQSGWAKRDVYQLALKVK